MKKVLLSLAILSSLALTSCKKEANAPEAQTTEAADAKASSEAAAEYKVDAAKSVIDWTGTKPTGKHTGTIHLKSGEIFANNGAVESGKFTIDMNSIAVTDLTEKDGKADLEGHLKGSAKEKEDHFFNVAKYPEAVFEITKVGAAVQGKSIIEGNLTMKGITKNIKFPAMVSIDNAHIALVSDTFTINRTQWGVNYASKSVFGDLGDKFVNDDIELKISVEAAK